MLRNLARVSTSSLLRRSAVAAASKRTLSSAHAASPAAPRVFDIDEGLNPIEPERGADLVRGVRLAEGVESRKTPRYSEYESAWEQDPEPQNGKGPSDEVYGEWGVDQEIPWFSKSRALVFWICGFGFFGLVGLTAKTVDFQRPAVLRELEDKPKF